MDEEKKLLSTRGRGLKLAYKDELRQQRDYYELILAGLKEGTEQSIQRSIDLIEMQLKRINESLHD